MPKKQSGRAIEVHFKLSDEELAMLDRLAKADGLTRADVVRQLVRAAAKKVKNVTEAQ